VVLLLSVIFSIFEWLKNTCIFHLLCIRFDITTENERNKLKYVNTFVPTLCRVSCDLEIPL